MAAALLNTENLIGDFRLNEGDAAVIIRKDGSFQLFNTAQITDPSNLSQEQIDLGRKLLGISAALQIPELMQILVNAATDSELFTKVTDLGTKQ